MYTLLTMLSSILYVCMYVCMHAPCYTYTTRIHVYIPETISDLFLMLNTMVILRDVVTDGNMLKYEKQSEKSLKQLRTIKIVASDLHGKVRKSILPLELRSESYMVTKP